MMCSDCYRDRVLADPLLAADVDEDYDGPDMGDGIGFAPGECAKCGRRGIVFGRPEQPADASPDYLAGYAAGRRDAMVGMLIHLCDELHSATFAAGYENGATS